MAVGGLVALALSMGVSLAVADGSATLLTPLPGRWTGPGLVATLLIAIGLAAAVASPLPRGIVRRLTALGVMACTAYFLGEATRGVYAAVAFSGEVERDEVRLLVTGASDGVLQVVDPARPGRVLSIPAIEPVTSSPPRGQCVTVPIERAPDGAERIASDVEPVTEEALGGCG